MASPIKPRRTTTPGKVPTTADLTDGELAVNIADAKIYVRDGATIKEVANAAAGGGGGAVVTGWNEVRLASNETKTNDTSMTAWFTALASGFSLEASSTYEIEGYFVSSNGANSHGLNMQFDAISGATIRWVAYGAKTVDATQATAIRVTDTNTFATARNVTTASTVAGNSVLLQGVVTTTTAGTLVPKVAQTAASGSFTALAGSYFRVRKVAGAGANIALVRKLTQAEYTALSSKDANTLYVIVG